MSFLQVICVTEISEKQFWRDTHCCYSVSNSVCFKIDCEPEDGLAQAETCGSIKQHRIQLCLDWYQTLFVDLEINNLCKYFVVKTSKPKFHRKLSHTLRNEIFRQANKSRYIQDFFVYLPACVICVKNDSHIENVVRRWHFPLPPSSLKWTYQSYYEQYSNAQCANRWYGSCYLGNAHLCSYWPRIRLQFHLKPVSWSSNNMLPSYSALYWQ